MDTTPSDPVEYFGPLNITIPPLSIKMRGMSVVHIEGVLYVCGGYTENAPSQDCFRYVLASNSSEWEHYTTFTGLGGQHPAIAFPTCNFFWYLTNRIQLVDAYTGFLTSFDIRVGNSGCAVGNGSHSVYIKYDNSSVLMNSDPLSPYNWTTVTTLNSTVNNAGCLWLGNTIYVTGGLERADKMQLINTDTFEVTLGAKMPIQSSSHSMGIIDGNPAVFGGYDNNVQYVSTIYVYDTATNTWSLSDRSLPEGAINMGAVTF